jgi:hypothetical protein
MSYADQIIRQVENREDITCEPNRENGDGRLVRVPMPELEIDGTHMILARTHRSLARWIAYLKDNNIPFKNDMRPEEWRWNPCRTKAWTAAKTWMNIKRNKTVSIPELKALGALMIADMAFQKGKKSKLAAFPDDKKFYSVFDMLPFKIFSTKFIYAKEHEFRNFIKFPKGAGSDFTQEILNRYPERILEEPRVTIGTIHSVKGGEADHVWIDPSLSIQIKQKIYTSGNDEDKDSEIRTAYVAVTRAKRTCGILYPANRSSFNPFFPEI